jgi:uncharacterized coiled-coil protein SlyX
MSRPKPDKNWRTRIPTLAEVNMSKAVIDEYEAKVVELQLDIDELREQADQLEALQTKYKIRIRKQLQIVAVARRLPPELLLLIFSFRVDGEFSYKLAIPMRVCRAWYHAVVSCCARLWSYVRLDGCTRHEWWNGALGSPTVQMPSTAPVMGYLRSCVTYSQGVPLSIYIYLGEFSQSLGAGPHNPNSVNVMCCLRTLIGENGKHLPRWRLLALHAGGRINLDAELLQIFYQEIPNLNFLHLQNFSAFEFPRFKSLPSLRQYSRGGFSGLHDIDSIPKEDRGNVTNLQTFITSQEWTPKDYRFCQAFHNIISLSLVNPKPSHVLCGDVMELFLPQLIRLYLEGPFDDAFLSELRIPKLYTFLICANDEGVDPLEDIFLANMELLDCSYVVWRNNQGNDTIWELRRSIDRLFGAFKALQRLDLEPWVEPIIPPHHIEEIMFQSGAWIGRKEPMLITYSEEMMYQLNPPGRPD